jgi:nitroreductase
MDFFETIRARRSIRKYSPAPVPRADLERIVDAGRLAATGSNRQPWDFIVVTEPTVLARLAAAGQWIARAPAAIAVVMDPASRWWVEDGSAAIENMLLAAAALGYGGCWVEGDALPREAEFKPLLGVPPDRRILALVPLGVPAEAPVKEKKPLAAVLHWEKF